MERHIAFPLMFFLPLLMTWIFVSTEGACLKAEYTAYGSLCFRVNPDIDIYTGAEAACLADGARLASVGSEEEHLFLVDLISKQSGYVTGLFLALRWVDTEWVWQDGSPLSFEKWAHYELMQRTNTRVVVMQPGDRQWADTEESYLYGHICMTGTRTEEAEEEAPTPMPATLKGFTTFKRVPNTISPSAPLPASVQDNVSTEDCALRCKEDPKCMFFSIFKQSGKQFCGTYTVYSDIYSRVDDIYKKVSA